MTVIDVFVSACGETAPWPVAPSVPFVVTGMVVDADTLQPIGGASVLVGGLYRSTTGATGSYSVTAQPPVGLYTDVRADGYDGDIRTLKTPPYVQDVRLNRARWIAPGDSVDVVVLRLTHRARTTSWTVAPGDQVRVMVMQPLGAQTESFRLNTRFTAK